MSARTNFAWTAVSSVVFQTCQWLVVVVLAHVAGDVKVGRFVFALAITLPPLLVASLNLRVALATDVRCRYLFIDFAVLRVGALALSTVGIVVGALLLCRTTAAALLIVLVGVAKCFDWVSDIVYGLLQKHQMMNRIAISRILQGVLQLAAIVVTVRLSGDLVTVAAVWAITSAVVTLSYDLRSVVLVVRRYPGEIAWDGWRRCLRRMRKLFRMSLPLAGTLVLGGLIGNVPIYALQHWRDSSDVGVLAVQLRLLLAAGLCFGALVDVATPRLAQYHAAREPAFRRLALRLLMVGVGNGAALVLGTVLAGETVLRLVYGPAYADVSLALMLAVSTTANLLCQVLLALAAATHRYRIAFRAAVGQLVVTVGLSVALVMSRGLWGAGVALLAGQCCCLAILAVGTTRFLRKRHWERPAATARPPAVVPAQRTASPVPEATRAD